VTAHPRNPAVKAISDADLLAMIIGRTLEAVFPPKHTRKRRRPLLQVEGAERHGSGDISSSLAEARSWSPVLSATGSRAPLACWPDAMRRPDRSPSRAGLARRGLLGSAAYMPADRLTEGLMVGLNVRRNAALTALDRLKAGPIVSRRREVEAAEHEPDCCQSPRSARSRRFRRKPTEGRDGTRDALRAGDSRR
jgi:ribose transport system ATP-binding protein